MAEQRKAWQGGASGGKPAGGKDWQKGTARKTPTPPGGPPWWQSRRVRIGAVVLAICAAVGVFVGVVVWPRPVPVPRLVLIEAGYEDNPAVPHNVPGRNACLAVEKWWETAVFPGTRPNDKGVPEKVLLDGDPLKVMEPLIKMRGRKDPRLVVYVAAHGVARPGDDGPVPYLVPQNHDPAKPAELFPFDALLDVLGSLSEDTEKLLVLDVSSVNASWSLGEYAPSFVSVLLSDRYAEKVKKIKKLVVLCSAGKDEAGWASPDRGTTAFAHFLLEGLKGDADGWKGGKPTGNRNLGVDTKELFDYLAFHVERWARHNRGREQHPVMIPPPDDAPSFEVVSARKPPAPEAPPAPAAEDDIAREVAAVGELWAECARLEKARPWERLPHLWRRYVETLVRAEELARYGGGDAASRVRTACADMARQLGRPAARPEASRRLTVPMEQTFGPQLTAAEQDALNRFTAALRASDYELAARSAQGAEGRLRMEALAALLGHAGTARRPGPWKGELSKQPGWLGVLGALDGGTPARPAEAHYLAMALHESAPPIPDDPALWRKAVEVRSLAERAALAGGPAVSPWLRQPIAGADARRRPAQDLLFTSHPARWADAGRELESAREGYEGAIKRAGDVGRAMRARDGAFARLPYLTRLIGEQSTRDEDAIRLEVSWKRLWELNAALAGYEPDVAKLDGMGAAVERDLADAQGFADRLAAELRDGHQKTQTPWHQIESFLRLPAADPALRAALVARSRDISHTLLTGAQDANAEALGATKAREGALRQAKLAAATTFPDEETRKALRERVNAGDYLPGIGEVVVRERIKAATTARDLTTSAGKEAPADAEKTLARAAAAFRTLDGWVGDDHHGGAQPAEQHHNLLLHVLLCRQAERAFHEHWVGEDGKPYFREAGGAFLKDAQRLYEGADPKSARLSLAASVGELLESARPLTLEWSLVPAGGWRGGDGDFHLTDEPALRRYYRLTGPGNVQGHSVRRVTATAELIAPPADVEPWKLDAVHPELIRPAKGLYERQRRKATHEVRAYFRGQRGAVATNVQIHREPDNLVISPPVDPTGRLAIVSRNEAFERYAASKHAIGFVLDASKSMVDSRMADGRTRWDVAKETLGKVLATLPRGVNVSLRVFGAKGSFLYEYNAKKQPVGIIKRDPTKLIWEPHPWDPAQLEARMMKVHAIEPAGYTPLMRAIKLAHDDLNTPAMAKRFEDRRTLVAITDGGDFTWYAAEFDRASPGAGKYQERDPEVWRGAGDTITAFLKRTFRVPPPPAGKGVKLAVIEFDGGFETKWEEKAYRETKKAVPAVGGTYDRAVNAADLFRLLTSRMLDLRFLVDADHGRPKASLATKSGRVTSYDPKSRAREVLDWVTMTRDEVPEDYRAWVPLLPGGIKQRLHLDPGDALVLEMTGKGDTPYYRRWMYINRLVDRAAFARRVAGEGRWVMGAVENHQEGSGGMLRTMTTLEKDDDTANPERHVQVIHPRFAWVELSSTETKALARPVRVTALPNYPAPAWGAIAPEWGLAEAVTMKGWWAEGTLPRASHLVLKPDEPITALRERDLVMKDVGDGVVVESVTIEDGCRVPMDQDGSVNTVIDRCLVVRLRYKPGTGPFLVKVGDVDWHGGHAHRFFLDAGKYTGIFWEATPAKVKKLRELTVYSVAELKRVSQSREIDLGPPRNTNLRPDPLK